MTPAERAFVVTCAAIAVRGVDSRDAVLRRLLDGLRGLLPAVRFAEGSPLAAAARHAGALLRCFGGGVPDPGWETAVLMLRGALGDHFAAEARVACRDWRAGAHPAD